MYDLDLQVTDLARELLMTTVLIAAPILIVGLIVGVAVSLFQALTSVQEQTMSLIPKMFAVMLVTLLVFWFRFTYPRFREDQLQRLAWKFLIPLSLLNIVATGILKVVF